MLRLKEEEPGMGLATREQGQIAEVAGWREGLDTQRKPIALCFGRPVGGSGRLDIRETEGRLRPKVLGTSGYPFGNQRALYGRPRRHAATL